MRVLNYHATPTFVYRNEKLVGGYPYGRIPQSTNRDYQYKPKGLWVSIEGDDDWFEWCCSENFCLRHLLFATEVVLKKDNNVLIITKAEELDAFGEKYQHDGPMHQVFRDSGLSLPSSFEREIDWERVSKDYDGIIIAPYIWSRRLDRTSFWYYSWDCASGCIWDFNCVEFYRPARGHYRRWLVRVPRAYLRNKTSKIRYRWWDFQQWYREIPGNIRRLTRLARYHMLVTKRSIWHKLSHGISSTP